MLNDGFAGRVDETLDVGVMSFCDMRLSSEREVLDVGTGDSVFAFARFGARDSSIGDFVDAELLIRSKSDRWVGVEAAAPSSLSLLAGGRLSRSANERVGAAEPTP